MRILICGRVQRNLLSTALAPYIHGDRSATIFAPGRLALLGIELVMSGNVGCVISVPYEGFEFFRPRKLADRLLKECKPDFVLVFGESRLGDHMIALAKEVPVPLQIIKAQRADQQCQPA